MNQETGTTKTRLRPARRHLVRAVLWDHVVKGLLRGGKLSALVGVVFVLYQLVMVLGPRYQMRSVTVFVAAAVSSLVLSISWSVGQGVRRLPTIIQVAERLDLTTNEHNLIATSLYLQTEARSSSFARAAVRQGEQMLAEVHGRSPMVDEVYKPWKSMLGCLLVIIGAGYGGMGLAGLAPAMGKHGRLDVPPLDRVKEAATVHEAPTAQEDRASHMSPVREQALSVSRSGQEKTQHFEAKGPSDHQKQLAMGNVRSGMINPPGYSFQNASSVGTSVEKAASNQGEKKKNSVSKPSDRKKQSDRNKPLEGEGGQDDSMVGQGLAGGRGGQAVKNSWGQELRMVEANEDEEDQNEEVDDQEEMNVHRGGIQPFLKDRNQAPSRELGISSDQGKPGTGRGGPSLPKKSRGTASLVLGISIPDFVKGRLGPGTNKVTHERSAPQTNPGQAASVVETGQRSLDESVCPRYDVLYEHRYLVQAYFLALSRQDNGVVDDTAAKGP